MYCTASKVKSLGKGNEEDRELDSAFVRACVRACVCVCVCSAWPGSVCFSV